MRIDLQKYSTHIPVTKIMEGKYDAVYRAILKFKKCNGRYLMRSLYRGKGRPKKSDYRRYYSFAGLEDLRNADLIQSSTITTYT